MPSTAAGRRNERMTLQVGVVGVGGMGRRHVENLVAVDGAAAVAIFDTDRKRLAEVAATYGVATSEDAAALIENSDVEAVIVASPDETHADLTLRCIELGKPVLCEKPLAVELDDAERVVATEAAGGERLVQVGFMRYYDPGHVAVKQVVDSGRIGRPLYFRGWHRNPPAEGMTTEVIMIRSAIHDLFSARWFLDAEISEVDAVGIPHDPSTADVMGLQVMSLRMSSGAVAVIEVNADSGFGYEVGVEVVGSEGVVTTPPPPSPVLRAGDSIGQPSSTNWLDLFEPAYVLELEAWVESIVADGPPGPSAWDGYATLAAAHAGLRSLAGEAQPVQLMDRP